MANRKILRTMLIVAITGCGCTPNVTSDGGMPDGNSIGPGDAGQVDAGQVDAGQVDAGQPDSGLVDGGQPDAGQPDSGVIDGGQPDSGLPDSGFIDGGQFDGGDFDAGHGDGGDLDSGPGDGGPFDGGPVDAGTCMPYSAIDAGWVDGGQGGACSVALSEGPEFEENCVNNMVCALDLGDEEDGGNGACTTPRYTVADGIVADDVTGLLWQQGSGPAQMADGGYTWDPTGQDPASAQYYCAHLDLGCLTWRVPDIVELFSIIDVDGDNTTLEDGGIVGGPMIDGTAFSGTSLNFYWSSTAGSDGGGWGYQMSGGYEVVGFTYVYTSDCNGTLNQCQVRCVH